VLRREAQQRLECGHWHAAAIEAKHEFIDLVRQVLRGDAVVRALEPGLEVREGPVDAREELGRILGITYRGGSIIVRLAEWSISLPVDPRRAQAHAPAGPHELARQDRGAAGFIVSLSSTAVAIAGESGAARRPSAFVFSPRHKKAAPCDALQDSIKRLHVLVDGKLNELAETIRLAQAGRFEDALAHAESGEGKQLMDGIRQVLGSLKPAFSSRAAAQVSAKACTDPSSNCARVECAIARHELQLRAKARAATRNGTPICNRRSIFGCRIAFIPDIRRYPPAPDLTVCLIMTSM
jgi:hypothetical protein